jgi:Ni2+-binding GTPase involved in maturation of urease and hydrogenase
MKKQRHAYDIITSQNGDNAEPVYMIVCGTAGTGKTYLISAAKQVLGTQCVVTATTGIAPFSINSQTLHSAAQLPIISVNIGICRVTRFSGYSCD